MSFVHPDLLWLLAAAPLAAVLAAVLWRRRILATGRWAGRELWGRLLPGYRPARIVLQILLLTLAVAASAGTYTPLLRHSWSSASLRNDSGGNPVDTVRQPAGLLDHHSSLCCRR